MFTTQRLSEPRLDGYEYQSSMGKVTVLLGFQIVFSDGATRKDKASLSLSMRGDYLLFIPKSVTDDSNKTEDLLNSKFWRILLIAKGHLNKFVADGRPEHKWYSIYLKDL
jgi:hypothetical protein